ncbi:MAG: CNNM domain-containing protein [Mariprofundales bacterium]
MQFSITIAIAVLVLLLLASAFFSGSETALTRARRARLRVMAKEGNSGAVRATRLLQKPQKMLTAILLGNNFVNIAASSLATALFFMWFGEIGVLYATIMMTVIVLIFSEILPKTLAVSHPEPFACNVARPLQWVILLLSPLIIILMYIVDGLQRILGVTANDAKDHEFSQKELASMIDIGAESGLLDARREQMLESSLNLHAVPVKSLMQPRRTIKMLNADDSIAMCLQVVGNGSHSRYPVYKNRSDNIIGIVHIRDFFLHIGLDSNKLLGDVLADLITRQSPPFIPDNKNALAQLIDFQKQRLHMAIIVDEYGDIEGIITMEDILEDIVGEIVDESDTQIENEMSLQKDGSLYVVGTSTIHDINQRLDLDLPEEGATTIGGLIVEMLGCHPEGKVCLLLPGLRIEVCDLPTGLIQTAKILICKQK